MAGATKRVVIRVQKRPGLPYWWIRVGGLEIPSKRQDGAIRAAVALARRHFDGGGLAQVVLHGRDGRIRWERTYPDSAPQHRG